MSTGASRLVLVRHAKSDYPWGVDDHDRPLNERGRRDAPAVGRWLAEQITWSEGDEPVALVSTATRAQLTWGLASAELGDRWQEVPVIGESRIYEAPVSALLDVVREAGRKSRLVVLVGHNPGLAGLVLYLAADDALRREATAKFPTSAIAVLEAEQPLAEAVDMPGSMRVSAFAVPRG